MLLHEVTVRVKALRHLPQQFFHEEKERASLLSKAAGSPSGHSKTASSRRRCLRAQASLVEDTRETGNSVWGKGVRSREATWLKGTDTLAWRLPEAQFKQVKAYTPVCKVHVYATDASAPSMDTSDSVGWFTVDMRDVAGQRPRNERWVKLQGASPAEVLISSSLSMVRAQDQEAGTNRKYSGESKKTDVGAVVASAGETKEQSVSGRASVSDGDYDGTETVVVAAEKLQDPVLTAPSAAVATTGLERAESIGNNVSGNPSVGQRSAGAVQTLGEPFETAGQGEGAGATDLNKTPPPPINMTTTKSAAVLTLPEAEAVSDLEALPVGPDSSSPDARTFSLSISIKSAARLILVAPPQQVDTTGAGFWFSYSVFGVVVQTDRFERLADPGPGDRPVLEPMLDSFRLRATLHDLCHFLGEAPPLQIYLCTERRIIAHADVDMSLLLPADQWKDRNASEFGRTGMQGDFELRRPGEPSVQQDKSGAGVTSEARAVVTICAQLTRADLTGGDNSSIWSDGGGDGSGSAGVVLGMTAAGGWNGPMGYTDREGKGATGVRTWTRPAPNATGTGTQQTEAGEGGDQERADRSAYSESFLSENEKHELFHPEVKQPRERGFQGTQAGFNGEEGVNDEERRTGGGVQAREAFPLGDGVRNAVGGKAPRSYRLSVNLASVKDLETAAYVVACYHYPYFGTSAPVRTSLVWVPPRMDTPLANSCCSFSFGMSLDRLSATVQDRPLVVSVRNKDRFKEEEMGLLTVPLHELVNSAPRYFRCRDTNKTFTSMTGFRAHLKSRQRSGEISSSDAVKATPIEVKVVDTYITVASTQPVLSPSDAAPGTTRLCSMRVMLLLEDMGPTGEADERDVAVDESPTPPTVARGATQGQGLHQQGVPTVLPSATFDGSGVHALHAMPPSLKGVVDEAVQGRADVSRVWAEWEHWRVREETAFANRLREKDQALEEKWTARETARRKDVAQAQQEYAKLEGKLRKALSEVEARERSLNTREEAWRTEHAQKLSELQLLQRRLREETKHQVDLERMKVKALDKQVKSQAKALEDARARVTATDEDFERFRQQTRKTSEGGLQRELFRLGAAKAEAEAQVERERSEKNRALLEKEEYRAHIHKLARALKRHQERESTCARREMEQLRLEYLAREERFILDGDRNELRTIKQELDELRHVSLVQEAHKSLVNKKDVASSPPQTTTTPPTTRPHFHSTQGRTGPECSGAELPGSTVGGSFPNLAGPSPSPPPRPTPAPAPTYVLHRLDRGVSISSDTRQSSGGSGLGLPQKPDLISGRGSSGCATGRGRRVAKSGSSDTSGVCDRGPSRGGAGRGESNGKENSEEGNCRVGSERFDRAGNGGGSGSPGEEDGELQRLVDWRKELLETGMYDDQNPIVCELSRRISSARVAVSTGGSGAGHPLQREE